MCRPLAHSSLRTGTCSTARPGARLIGSAFARIVTLWGYKGIRVGEASNPGPERDEPLRVVVIHRVPVGEEASRPCSIRLSLQGTPINPPLRVAGRKTPAEALQKWLQKFQDHIVPASQAILRDLCEQWREHPIPPPPWG